jgi:hypothetical protein
MSKKMDQNKVINGTFGRVWMNGELYSNVKSFDSKVTLNYEEVNMADDLATYQKYMGYAGEGSVSLHKIDSHVAKTIGDGITTGVMPDIKIVGRLSDPAAYGAERVEYSGVTFDELTLLKFANKEIQEEEVPFKFAKFKYLDMIN